MVVDNLAGGIEFQLTRPVWGEPWYVGGDNTNGEFQLTRPVWGEPRASAWSDRPDRISTHSPRVGRTQNDTLQVYIDEVISTHSPRVGRTYCFMVAHFLPEYFNSLAPCGANRIRRGYNLKALRFQLTRPVWGEPNMAHNPVISQKISTHSPRVGRTRAGPLAL